MRYFPLLLGAVFLLLVLFSAAQLIDGTVEPHPSLGRAGSVLALLTVAAFGASLIARGLPAHVSPRATSFLRVGAFAGLGALLLRAGFDVAAFATGRPRRAAVPRWTDYARGAAARVLARSRRRLTRGGAGFRILHSRFRHFRRRGGRLVRPHPGVRPCRASLLCCFPCCR